MSVSQRSYWYNRPNRPDDGFEAFKQVSMFRILRGQNISNTVTNDLRPTAISISSVTISKAANQFLITFNRMLSSSDVVFVRSTPPMPSKNQSMKRHCNFIRFGLNSGSFTINNTTQYKARYGQIKALAWYYIEVDVYNTNSGLKVPTMKFTAKSLN